MIDREKVLALLGVANAEGQAVKLKPSELAELCRVYLAWLDADEQEVFEHWSGNGELYPDSDLIGKRVRLVEVK